MSAAETLGGYRRREVDWRGSSYDRRARKRWLIDTFGDGTTVPCHYCGRPLTFATLTVDRIVPGVNGGRYVRDNILPACLTDNSSRQDTPLEVYEQRVAFATPF